MKKYLKKVTKLSPVQSRILNLSNKNIWVIETDTKRKGYDAVAHLLRPDMKTPRKTDIDGFMREDSGSIEGHRSWWKIPDLSQVMIFNKGKRIRAISLFGKRKVSKNEFGKKVFYDRSKSWALKVTQVESVKRDRNNKIVAYYIDSFGWVKRNKAIELAKKGEIDNVVVVKRDKNYYLRSRPDGNWKNNYSKMGRT